MLNGGKGCCPRSNKFCGINSTNLDLPSNFNALTQKRNLFQTKINADFLNSIFGDGIKLDLRSRVILWLLVIDTSCFVIYIFRCASISSTYPCQMSAGPSTRHTFGLKFYHRLWSLHEKLKTCDLWLKLRHLIRAMRSHHHQKEVSPIT